MNVRNLKRWIIPIVIVLVTLFYNAQIGTVLIVGYIIYLVWGSRTGIFAHIAVRKYHGGDIEGALKWYGRAAENTNANATVLLSYALLLLKRGKFDAAEQSLERAAEEELSEYNQKALSAMRGLLKWKRGNSKEAAAQLGKLAEEFKNSTLFGALGSLYLSEGMLERALQHNLEAKELDPDNQIIADNLGRTYYEKGDVDRAEQIFDDLIEREVQIPEPYLNKALILESRDELEEATGMTDRARNYPYSYLSYFSPEDFEQTIEKIEAKTE